MIRKLLLITSLYFSFSFALMAQYTAQGISIETGNKSSLFEFSINDKSFFCIDLYLNIYPVTNHLPFSDASFISLQLQDPKSNNDIEFARVYLANLNTRNQEITYEFDLQMWQKWLIANPLIKIESNTNIDGIKFELELIGEEGKPCVDVLDIIPLWQSGIDGFPYSESGVLDSLLPEHHIKLPNDTKYAIANFLISGKAQDTCETLSRFYFLKINDADIAKRSIWREDCAFNPLRPQQDDWFVSRPNWCPGLKVYALQHFIQAKYIQEKSIKLELSFQKDQKKTSKIESYITSSVLFAIGETTQKLNLSINEIYAPNNKIWHESYNPICSSPVILIQNTGSEKVESITFSYGYNFDTDNKFKWKGELEFLEQEIIYLPSLNWYFFEKGDEPESFTVHISAVNGNDILLRQGKKTSEMTLAEIFPSHLLFELNTDEYAHLNGLEIFDDAGISHFSSGELQADTSYSFPVDFPPGCYEMIFYDEAKDGVKLKANTENFLRIKDREKGIELKSFDGNFGGEIREQFMIFR